MSWQAQTVLCYLSKMMLVHASVFQTLWSVYARCMVDGFVKFRPKNWHFRYHTTLHKKPPSPHASHFRYAWMMLLMVSLAVIYYSKYLWIYDMMTLYVRRRMKSTVRERLEIVVAKAKQRLRFVLAPVCTIYTYTRLTRPMLLRLRFHGTERALVRRSQLIS